MPDPNVTLTAIETHATALEGAMKRHSANAGRCKVWSLAIIAGVMVFAGGKTQMGALPWVAVLVVLLALADACAVVMARACTDAYHAFMRKLPLNGGNGMKAEECFILPAPEPAWRQAGQVFGAMGSLSVLPFYGALLALVVAFHVQMSEGGVRGMAARLLPSAAAKAGCSAGGGCGTSGGCGSGGCGASSGKGCGCGSETTAKKTTQSTAVKAAHTPVSSSLRMNVPQNPANPGSPLRQNAIQPVQPGQPGNLAPLRQLQQQPAVRLPAPPQSRMPQEGIPQNGVPQNGVPQNGVPSNAPSANGLPANAAAPNGAQPNGAQPNAVPSQTAVPRIPAMPVAPATPNARPVPTTPPPMEAPGNPAPVVPAGK